jgi:thioredoxin:protein disulfide reductase
MATSGGAIFRGLVSLMMLAAVACFPRTACAEDQVRAELLLSADKLAPGTPFRLAAVINVAAPWHINANPATMEGFIPTTLTVQTPPTIVIDRIVYPQGKKTTVSWADQPVELYTGRVIIFAEAHVRPDAAPAPLTLEGNLRYQACNDHVCLAPVTVPLKLATEIVPSSEPRHRVSGQPIHPEIFGATATTTATSSTSATEENSIARMMRERGLLATLAFIFVSGLLLNLTPCVYPMITITVSYFGGKGEKKSAAAFAGALAYFFGIVITYSSLGLAAALTGGFFGALLQNPVVLGAIGLLLVAMALSMFGLYELQPPQFLMQRASTLSSKAGYVGLFFLGATVGVIAAPCLAPIVIVVLAFAGSSGDPWIGWWLFFALGAGLGLPYIVLGTSSSLLTRLPKSGMWMVWVKRVFGVALIAVALWITNPLWLRSAPATSGGGIAWRPYSLAALQQAATDKRPVLIDFYADWCIPCREMDKKTYPNQQVIEKSRQFLMFKADLTRTGSSEVEQLTKQFQIFGVPTTVFVGPEGRERAELRKVGFVPPQELLDAMGKALVSPAASTNAAASTQDIPPQLLHPF